MLEVLDEEVLPATDVTEALADKAERRTLVLAARLVELAARLVDFDEVLELVREARFFAVFFELDIFDLFNFLFWVAENAGTQASKTRANTNKKLKNFFKTPTKILFIINSFNNT